MNCEISLRIGAPKEAVMIDYLTCRISLPVQLPKPIHGGYFVRVGADDEVELTTLRRKRVIGSHEAGLHIRAPSVRELEIEGNPAKFLQGHNLYGTNDPLALLWATLQRFEEIGALGCQLSELGLHGPEIVREATSLSRVDCTVMMLADTPMDVLSILRSLRVAGRLRDRGRSGLPHAWQTGDGVSFGSAPGKSARHRSITFYSKGQDVTVHPLPALMAMDADVIEWVNRSLRCEVRLGGNYLRKNGLRTLGAWENDTALREWQLMMDRMDMNGSDERPAAVDDLPSHLRLAFGAWQAGEDLRAILSRPTYYRQRRAILEAVGVDIAIPRPKEPTAQIVPFKRIISLEPVGRPEWADRVERMLSAA